LAAVLHLSSFGEDEAGEVYAVSLDGKVYRFEEDRRSCVRVLHATCATASTRGW
jgi:hypothetical protein